MASLGLGPALPLGSRHLPHQSGLELLQGPGRVRGCSKELQAGRPQAGRLLGSGRSLCSGGAPREGLSRELSLASPASQHSCGGPCTSLAQVAEAWGSLERGRVVGWPGLRWLRPPPHRCPQVLMPPRLAVTQVCKSPSIIRGMALTTHRVPASAQGPSGRAPGPGVRHPLHLWDTWGGVRDGGLRGCGAPTGLRGPVGASVTQSDDGPVMPSRGFH